MQSGRLFFDHSSSVSSSPAGNMLFRATSGSLLRGPSSMVSMEDMKSNKRPFFYSQEDYFDDEYYDEQVTDQKKRRLTPEQVNLLEKSFEEENKLEPERKTQLAKKLGLQPRQVAVWFQNRRARWKTKQLERDYDLLKASYDSLLSNHDNIVKENEKLKSEVFSLTEKLQAKEEVTGATIPGGESKSLDPVMVTATTESAFELKMKVEDRLSSGSAGSAVVDEDNPQLLDSGDSFLQNNNYGAAAACVVLTDHGIPSEEDDGSDDGRSYFSHVFVTADQQQQEVEDTFGWWMWP